MRTLYGVAERPTLRRIVTPSTRGSSTQQRIATRRQSRTELRRSMRVVTIPGRLRCSGQSGRRLCAGSALDDIQREPGQRRFFVARLHVETGFVHSADDLVEGDLVFVFFG